MAKVKLTERYLAGLKPGPGRIWDEACRGLFALSGKKGPVFYAKVGGVQVRIGAFKQWTLEEARSRADEIRQKIDKGESPKPTTLPTLEEAFHDYEAVRLPKRGERTGQEYRRAFGVHILPRWGKRKIDRIDRPDAVRLHDDLTAAGHPVLANRVLAALSSVYGWLRKDRGHKVDNPAAMVERNDEHGREIYLTPSQCGEVLTALEAYGARGGQKQVAADCVAFILSSGCRPSEGRGARWEHLSDDLATWHKPARIVKQRKPHRIPLGPAAHAILVRRLRLRKRNEPMVFPPERGKLLDIRKAWRFAANQAVLDGVRVHDLRHTYASLAVSSGVPLKVLGGLLGHSAIATTNRYAHLYEDDLRAAAGAVSARIESKREGGR